MADPYRTPGGSACPQCGEQLDLSSPAAVTCANGCGEWWPRGHLTSLLDLEDLELMPYATHYHKEQVDYRTPPCPRCGKEFALAWIETLPVRTCAEHGIWVSAAVRDRFAAKLAAPMERRRRIDELTALIASTEPADRSALARRILALEDQVASLTVLAATEGHEPKP